MIILKTT